MVQTYKYCCTRIRKPQREALNDLFRHLAWLRNDVVAHCRSEFAAGQKIPSFFDLRKRLTTHRQTDERDAKHPMKAQRSMLQRVRHAYDKFFKDGKGRPRFKPAVDSLELEGVKPKRRGGYFTVQIKGVGKHRFKDKRGVLAGSGLVRIVRHQLGTGYDVQLVVRHTMAAVREAIGIVVGVKANCTLSNGAQYAPIRMPDQKRKKVQRQLARAKRQSKARCKKKLALAREWRRITIVRRNVVHAITTDIVKQHSSNISVEDLRLQSMAARGGTRKRGLNRSMREQCLGIVMQQLACKAESAGGEFVKVKPHYTSQTCSACGHVPAKSIGLAAKTYVCSACRHRQDRDIDGARNTRLKGLELFIRAADPACRTEAAQAVNVVPLAVFSKPVKRGHDTGSYR